MSDSESHEVTMQPIEETSFARPILGLSMVGVLTVIESPVCDSLVRIEGDELVIGRGEPSDGIDLQLADGNVSRRHARILRVAHHFVIEDLNSSNGTFVDGIPIRSAMLHDGDIIQMGRSQFYFDHLFEFSHPSSHHPSHHSSQSPTAIDDAGGLTSSVAVFDAMTVRFWGTRGSIPTPGSETRKYGGNTTCLEIRYADTIIVVDAGSGIRELSKSWAEQNGGNPVSVNLLFTHLHWDHIQGFPFFGAAYQKGNSIDIYGAQRAEGSTKELLSGQMQGAYFPIPLAAMQATLNFHETQPEFMIGPVKIQTHSLPHPGGSLGYRFSVGESVFVFATDSEFDKVAKNHDELKTNHLAKRQFDPSLIRWMEHADVLVIDCQYSDEEYQLKAGWGHNSIATVVDLCEQVRPKMLGLIHHDPMSLDTTVAKRVHETTDRLRERGVKDILVFGAREQLSLAVQKPKKPIKL